MKRVLGWALTALFGVVSAVLALSGVIHWGAAQPSGLWGVAQVISFRAVMAIGFIAIAALSAALPGRRRRKTFGAIALVAAVLNIGIIGTRGIFPAELPAQGAEGLPPGSLVVMTLNTHGGDMRPKDLAALIQAEHADIVTLPETSREFAQQTADALSATFGIAMAAFGEIDNTREQGTAKRYVWSTSSAILVAERLGNYSVDPSSLAPQTAFTIRSSDPAAPIISVVHPNVPFLLASMDPWRVQTREAVTRCGRGLGTIVAGDFNATLDHPAFAQSQCADAALEARAAGLGTFPANIPALLGTPIDHVLYDDARWKVVGVKVGQAPGRTDHRPVTAVLEAR